MCHEGKLRVVQVSKIQGRENSKGKEQKQKQQVFLHGYRMDHVLSSLLQRCESHGAWILFRINRRDIDG